MEQKEVIVGGLRSWVWLGSSQPKVLVVLVHGRTRSHDDMDKIAIRLLKNIRDVAFATFDLPNHGTRVIDHGINDEWDNGNSAHMTAMLAICDQGAAEAELLLRYLPTLVAELRHCQHRLLAGVSLGGHVTWKVASEGSRYLLSGAVPLISCPDLAAMFKERWSQQSRFAPDDAMAFPPDIIAELDTRKKLRDQLRGSDLKMLAVCGADDKLVPAVYTQTWAKGLDATSQQKLVVLPGVGHAVPPEMIQLLGEFISSFL